MRMQPLLSYLQFVPYRVISLASLPPSLIPPRPLFFPVLRTTVSAMSTMLPISISISAPRSRRSRQDGQLERGSRAAGMAERTPGEDNHSTPFFSPNLRSS